MATTSSTADETRDAARLAGIALQGMTNRIHELHSGVADRAFAGVGPTAQPVQKVHDAIADLAHLSVGAALRAGAGALGGAAAQRGGSAAFSESPRGLGALSALNGLYGDLVAREAPALTITMTVRQAGRLIPVDRSSLEEAFPKASGRVVVFLHGLGESEGSWRYRSAEHHGRPDVTYGALLERELGYSAVYVRYNTGLHISDNGRALADLLEQVAAGWPAPIQDLVLIGHSMGGLVARSALHHAAAGRDQAAPWTTVVRDTITLGSPHLGAPLERGTHALTHTFARLPETRPLARILALRSVGIKDLRRGTLVSGDWADRDLDSPEPATHTHVPLHDGARHFAVLATWPRDPRTPAAELVGDWLVTPRSAVGDTGDEHRLAFPPDHVHRLGGLNHLDLLNHPLVYRQIRAWLQDRPTADVPSLPSM